MATEPLPIRYEDGVKLDLLFDPFDGSWPALRRAAIEAETAGFDGIWTWDHLAGSVHDASSVLECWTLLTAIAAVTERVAIGPLVLNVANRHPGTLAPMAATLQQVAAGRLLLGVGAGGGVELPYASEQRAVGRPVPADAVRRDQLREHVAALRQLWTGDVSDLPGRHVSLHGGYAGGFLRPEPAPPIVIGAFGPKMARLAGEIAEGVNLPARTARLPELVAIARQAHAATGRDPDTFLVTVFAAYEQLWLQESSRPRARLEAEGIDRLILLLSPPYVLPRLPARPR